MKPPLPWSRPRSQAQWQEEILFTDGDAYYTDLLKGLKEAKASISLECYIFEKGQWPDLISNELKAAAQRGLEVRVLVDGVGSPRFWSEYGDDLQRSQVQIRFYRTWPWQWRGLQKPLILKWLYLIWGWLEINRGSHRKYCLVDETVAWLGSFNLSDVHSEKISGDRAWLDAGVRIKGPELHRLTRAFRSAFSRRPWTTPRQRSNHLLILNSSFVIGRSSRHHLVQRIRKARERIWIQTPYFVPVGRVYRALIRQARRGVDVRLILPAVNDIPLMKTLTHEFLSKLIESGVKIFEYQQRFPHQKILQVDNWICLGTSNFNHRSFLHDLEVDVVITNDKIRQNLRDRFLDQQFRSHHVTIGRQLRRPFLQRLMGRLLLLFRYWT